MKPVAKFADTDFDIVNVDGRLFAISSYDRAYANAFECADCNTKMAEPNDYRLFPKTADGERLVDFLLSEVDHFKIVDASNYNPKSFYAHTSADWLFKKEKRHGRTA